MVLVGAILLVLCLIVGVGIALPNTEPVTAEAFGISLSNVSVAGLFLAGAVLGALTMLGLGLILVGLTRKRHKQVARKRQAKSARGEKETLAEENSRLQAELERERAASMPTSTASNEHTGDRPGSRGRH